MAEPFKKPHLTVSKFHASLNYKSPDLKNWGPSFETKFRDRQKQGKKILGKLAEIDKKLTDVLKVSRVEDVQHDNVVYINFSSEWGYDLAYEQLHSNSKANANYKLVNVRRERHPEDESLLRYNALVVMNKRGVAHFIKKATRYLTENSVYEGKDTGNPIGNKLIANVEDLKIATLEAFWVDASQYEFPERNTKVWWEVWFRKTENAHDKIISQLNGAGLDFSESKLEFGQNIIRLVKATAVQLSNSLMLLDNLMELRRPQEMNDFITDDDITHEGRQEWLAGLVDRTNIQINESSVLICLLDTGVNNTHNLLKDIIPDENLYAYRQSWGTEDSEINGGHGTAMAGLALYGDLTDAMDSKGGINLYHGIESFKVKTPQANVDETQKPIFGEIYKAACATSIPDRPNPRVYCLTVTNDGFAFYGRPSVHSAALDSIAFGGVDNSELIIVSGGTLNYNKTDEYPDRNFVESIADPAQAYNVITVGSYTCKDKSTNRIETPISAYGAMSPNNSTSGTWENQWPNKPDIVLEGGNLSSDGTHLWQRPELKPLSIDKEYPNRIFLPFDGTCSASAFAAKFAAELRTEYPAYWPETIRALTIHSADWTKEMIQGRDMALEDDRRAIIRSVGYGVPNLEKAIYSFNNSLTLIAESYIYPYKQERSAIKYNEFHLYELPWPQDVLRNELAEKDVKVTVTLSYFIEPNPGERRYANNFSYHSHELDFKLKKATETLKEFKRRVSSHFSTENEGKLDLSSEPWDIKEGIRSKGSIKKDYLNTNGANLSEIYHLAIYPKNGWYKTRKALNKFGTRVRYSLIVSIETSETDIDIYTPVENKIISPISISS